MDVCAFKTCINFNEVTGTFKIQNTWKKNKNEQ